MINRYLIDGSKRQGEMWIGSWGVFWQTLHGVELPSGKFIGWSKR